MIAAIYARKSTEQDAVSEEGEKHKVKRRSATLPYYSARGNV